MKKGWVVGIIVFLLSSSCEPADSQILPAEVEQFIEKRDLCDHFRGEHTGGINRSRDQEVILEEDKYCIGSDSALKLLREKYKDNPAVFQTLAKYDDCIEGNCGATER
jgi:hypothetical protein